MKIEKGYTIQDTKKIILKILLGLNFGLIICFGTKKN